MLHRVNSFTCSVNVPRAMPQGDPRPARATAAAVPVSTPRDQAQPPAKIEVQRSLLKSFASAALAGLAVLTWPLKKLKHGLMWLAEKPHTTAVLAEQVASTKRALAAEKHRTPVAADVTSLLATREELRTCVKTLNDYNCAAQAVLERHNKNAHSLLGLSTRQQNMQNRLARANVELAQQTQATQAAEAELVRLTSAIDDAQADLPKLVALKEAYAACVAKTAGQLAELNSQLADAKARAVHVRRPSHEPFNPLLRAGRESRPVAPWPPSIKPFEPSWRAARAGRPVLTWQQGGV